MTPTTLTAPATPSGVARRGRTRTMWLLVVLAVLAATCLLSLAVGSKALSPAEAWDGLWHGGDSDAAAIVRTARLPRTLLGVLAGAGLGVSGALIMAMTRNPLADPGILGVNAGASFAVALGVAALGLTNFEQYVWFSFAGAVVATVAVYLIGGAGRRRATPVRLTLAGVALGAVLAGITSGIALLDRTTFDRLRFWGAGSLAGPDLGLVARLAPFVLVGLVIALTIARPLNAIALGEELAVSVGARVATARALGLVAVTLLCGAVTAVTGPIGFVGLMVPHIGRWLLGPDQRWVIAFSALGGAVLLLLADIAGRVVLYPGEIQAGIVTGVLGAPVLIVLVRRRNVSGL